MIAKTPLLVPCPSAGACRPTPAPRVPGAPPPPGAWRRIGAISDVPAAGVRSFLVDGIGVLVVRVGDEWLAVQALCPHEGVPLDLGAVEGERLTCLEHMWQFDLRSGVPLGEEATEGLRTFPVRSEGDDLYVSLG